MVDLFVRRIPVGKHDAFILEFTAMDGYSVRVTLLTNADPTMVDTNYTEIDSKEIHREAELCEDTGNMVQGTLEPMGAFVHRAIAEAHVWSQETLVEYGGAKALVSALLEALPPGIQD